MNLNENDPLLIKHILIEENSELFEKEKATIKKISDLIYIPEIDTKLYYFAIIDPFLNKQIYEYLPKLKSGLLDDKISYLENCLKIKQQTEIMIKYLELIDKKENFFETIITQTNIPKINICGSRMFYEALYSFGEINHDEYINYIEKERIKVKSKITNGDKIYEDIYKEYNIC